MKINPTKTIDELITALAFAIDIDKNRKIYHAWRVAILSACFSQNKISPRKLKDIFIASLLHDIGGVDFARHIIYYLKRQDKASRNLLLSHPIVGAQLVSNIPRMNPAAKLILDHHEWINGFGYPRAKTEEYIPWGSQIIRLADSVDINLRTARLCRLKELKNKISLNVNKEYSKKLFKNAFDILRENRLFNRVSVHRNIPIIFREIKDKVGFTRIPLRIDAIGEALEVLAQVTDMKHPYTAGHSLRISRYAMSIALTMNLKHDEITCIKWAGLIHDIGKLGVSRQVLDKPTALTVKDFQEIKSHVVFTQKIMEMIPTLKEITPIAVSHHEYFDGTGYPQGLKGKTIPLGARILVICDAFDAMTSNRPYRKPLTPQEACQEIKKLFGKQFDPEIAKIALPLFKSL